MAQKQGQEGYFSKVSTGEISVSIGPPGPVPALVYTPHLCLHIGKVSLPFATSIEHGCSSLYRALLRGHLASNKHTITSLMIYSSRKSVKNPLLFMILIIISIETKISVDS
jgi:hypothetical protein